MSDVGDASTTNPSETGGLDKRPATALKLGGEAETAGNGITVARGPQDARIVQPGDINEWFKRIAASDRNGTGDDAEAAVQEASQHFSHFALEYGHRAARQSRWDEATVRWQKGLERFPDEPRLHAALAEGLVAIHRHVEAEAHLAEASKIFGNDVSLLSRYARLAECPGRWDEAIARWYKVIAVAPDDVGGLARLGHCLWQAGRLSEAQDLLLEAEARLPPHPLLSHYLALWAEPEWDLAVPRWRQMQKQFPDNVQAHMGLASSLARSGRALEAEAILKCALEKFPAD